MQGHTLSPLPGFSCPAQPITTVFMLVVTETAGEKGVCACTPALGKPPPGHGCPEKIQPPGCGGEKVGGAVLGSEYPVVYYHKVLGQHPIELLLG